jgi:succinate dehydrogenase/fumarate reductase cytochrome b subunit
MKSHLIYLFVFLLFPTLTFAQGLQTYIGDVVTFIGNYVIPFLLGLAFVFFVINVIRFFVIESTSEDGREKAKALAIYSVLAFLIIIIFWGIVNLLAGSFGLSGGTAPTSDYMQRGTGNSPTLPVPFDSSLPGLQLNTGGGNGGGNP